MQLNGWKRIGIVITLIWAIFGFFWGNWQRVQDGNYVTQQYLTCTEAHTDLKVCTDNFQRDYPVAISHHFLQGVAVAVIPIPFAWLLAFGLAALTRWVRAGFKVSTQS